MNETGPSVLHQWISFDRKSSPSTRTRLARLPWNLISLALHNVLADFIVYVFALVFDFQFVQEPFSHTHKYKQSNTFRNHGMAEHGA